MSTARAHLTATQLATERILVVGGAGVFTAELYDPPTGTWIPAGTLNESRALHAAVRLADGRVLVAGGGWYGASAELYDPATNRWTPTGSMNVGRISFTGTLLPDGRVLVFGGNSLSGVQASAELYDPATSRWTLTGSLRTPRSRHTATLLTDGSVLAAGGISVGSTGWPQNAELYDPARGRWMRAGTMTTGREGATATLLANGRVLVAGGGNPSALDSAELYDPASRSWTATGSMTAVHPGGVAARLHGGRVLVAGYSAGDVYSPATGTWTATGPMVDFGLYASAAALLPNGQVLYAGGRRDFYCGQYACSEDTAKAELYTPYVDLVVGSPEADLALTKTDPPGRAPTGRNLTYTLTVTNNGPDAASGVTVVDQLPPSVTFVSATPSQGSCGHSSGTVTCNLGTMGNGATARVDIVVKPTVAGTITNTAFVTAATRIPTKETTLIPRTHRSAASPHGGPRSPAGRKIAEDRAITSPEYRLGSLWSALCPCKLSSLGRETGQA
jgi:uncharacterized repeat protein (TIGR01451 family)